MPPRPASTSAFLRDPDLPFLESRDSRISGSPFGLHAHGTYSVAVVAHGATLMECRGGRWPAGPGCVVFLPPGEPHACNPRPGEPLCYRMHYIDRAWLEDRLHTLPRALDHRTPAILDDPALAESFHRFAQALDAGADADADAKNALFLAAMERLFACTRAVPLRGGGPRAGRRAAQMAARILAARPAERIPLAQLARACGVSPCHLPRIFRETHAMTPRAYANQLRVELAKRLLAQGRPIAQVAAEAGRSEERRVGKECRSRWSPYH